MNVFHDFIPVALQESGLFCCWRYEERDGMRTKVPYNPVTGGGAQSSNRNTFAPFAVALDAMRRCGYDGIGVGIFDNLGAIDIDHCISDAGELSPMAAWIIDVMDTYTELSPSRHGIRILFTVPNGFQYDKTRYYINNPNAKLEVYIAGATSKYVTVTGDVRVEKGLEMRGDALLKVLESYMKRPVKAPAREIPAQATASPAANTALDDAALIHRIRQSKNGEKFSKLWSGDTGGYDSHSEADLSLCDTLAWWTNGDAARIDRLFRQSGLMREKWNRPTGGSTYGAITIEKAINTRQGGYNPQAYSQKQAGNVAAPETDRRVTLADLRPERNPRYHWGDLGNGNLFADWYRAVARYCPERKTWYVYDGTRWVSDTGNVRTMQLCKQLADALVIYALSLPEGSERDSYRAHVEKWQNRRYRETILKDAGSVFPVPISEFDRDKYLYNCLNGTLDLRTFAFMPHNSKDMLTLISGVSYNPDITSPLWEKSVNDAMEGERDKIVFLQKIFGRCLTGDTSEERMYILYGRTSRNGKGTILESFMAMSGSYGRAVFLDSITQKQMFNGSGSTEEIARLAGARVANISEPDKNMVLSAALVKSLTGNDTIRARYLYENSFEFRPQFKMIINCNYLPKITDSTVFTSGRVCVVQRNSI